MPSIDMSLCVHAIHGGGAAWQKILDSGLKPDAFFDDGRKVFEHTLNHFTQYGKTPDAQTVFVDTNIMVPALTDIPEPVDYYIDRLKSRAVDNLTKNRVKEQLEAMDKGDAKGAIAAAHGLMSDLHKQNLVGEVIEDWTQRTDDRWKDYEEAKATPGGMIGLPTPWNTLNEKTQGIQKGDLWIIVGRPSTGKSWIEVVMATYLWRLDKRPLFVSLEMQTAKIMRRLDANYMKLDYRNLRTGKLGMIAEPIYQQNLAGLKGKHPLHVVTRKRVKTVQDIAILIEQLDPDVTIIDGMYKLKVPYGNRLSQWEKMTEIMDQLHEMVQEKKHRIVASTQFNRDVKKGSTKASIDALAFADAIGMNADVIFGLLPTDEMRENKQTLFKMLKNREDDMAHFRAKFDVFAQEFDEIGPWFDSDEGGGGGADVGGDTEVQF